MLKEYRYDPPTVDYLAEARVEAYLERCKGKTCEECQSFNRAPNESIFGWCESVQEFVEITDTPIEQDCYAFEEEIPCR